MYQFQSFRKLHPAVCHGMSDRPYGNQSYLGRPSSAIYQNRLGFFQALFKEEGGMPLFAPGNGVAMRPGFKPPLKPEHEIQVVTYGDRGAGVFPSGDDLPDREAEALVTRDAGVFFLLTVGDCLAVPLYDPVAGVLALAHVSRVTASYRSRGDACTETIPPLIARLIDVLVEKFEVKPERLVAGISPSISRQSYKLKHFASEDVPEWQPFLTKVPGGVHVDLAGFTRWLLGSKGVLAENIEIAGLDTVTARAEDGSFRFFSHYRSTKDPNEPEGRNAFVIGMPHQK